MAELSANSIMLALATEEILGAGIVLTRGCIRGRRPSTGRPASIVITIPASSYAEAEIVFCDTFWTLHGQPSALLLKQYPAFVKALEVLDQIGVHGARELADRPMPPDEPDDSIGFP